MALVDRVPAVGGFFSRSSFRLKSDVGPSPICKAGNTVLSTAARPDGWLEFNGLQPATLYDVTCEGGARFGHAAVRTLAASREVAVPGAQFTQDGMNFTTGSCFGDARALAFNRITGSLDIFGNNRGSASAPPNACFATYDGLQWRVVRFRYPGEVAGQVIDYNAGIGLAYLDDGTTVARDTVAVGGASYNRLNFCARDCGVTTNWTSLVLDGPLGVMNPCQASIALTPDRSKLLVINNCGTTHYTECPLTTTCRQLSNWSTPTLVQNSVGSGTHVLPFFDVQGGLWLATASSTIGVAYCPPGDCKVGVNWRQGKFPGQTFQISSPFFRQEGSTIQFAAARDWTTGGSEWLVASCDTAVLDCGLVDGSGVYANFSAHTFTMPEGRLQAFRSVQGGFQYSILDKADGHKLKSSRCSGSFAACFADASHWSSLSLMSDGMDHVWSSYMEHGGFVDGRGDPLSFMGGEDGLVYYDPWP